MHEKRVEMIKKMMGDRFDAERAAKMPSSEEIYTKIDADGNKSVTKEEMTAMRKKWREHHKGGRHHKGLQGEGGCNKAGAGKSGCGKGAQEKEPDSDIL